jgi:Flp pilus assembly protein TadD
MIHMQAGEVALSQSILQKLRNKLPKESARFYLLEAELLMEAEQFTVSYAVMTEAVSEHADNLMLRYARSIAATEVGELAVAEQDLLLIISKEPENVNALNALGYTLASKTFRFKEARRYLTQANSLKPNDSAIMDSLGWLNYREGRYEEALVLLEKAYKQMPEGEIAAHLGETLWMLGRQKEARELWENALKNDVKNRYLIEVLKRLQ